MRVRKKNPFISQDFTEIKYFFGCGHVGWINKLIKFFHPHQNRFDLYSYSIFSSLECGKAVLFIDAEGIGTLYFPE